VVVRGRRSGGVVLGLSARADRLVGRAGRPAAVDVVVLVGQDRAAVSGWACRQRLDSRGPRVGRVWNLAVQPDRSLVVLRCVVRWSGLPPVGRHRVDRRVESAADIPARPGLRHLRQHVPQRHVAGARPHRWRDRPNRDRQGVQYPHPHRQRPDCDQRDDLPAGRQAVVGGDRRAGGRQPAGRFTDAVVLRGRSTGFSLARDCRRVVRVLATC
jgi:hypothetical protein